MAKRPLGTFLLLALPTVVVVVAALILMNLRTPAHIRLTVAAASVELVVAGSEPVSLIERAGFSRLSVSGFGRADVPIGAGGVQTLRLEAKGPASNLIVEPIPRAGGVVGTLGTLYARGGAKIVIAAQGVRTPAFRIRSAGGLQSVDFSHHRAARLTVYEVKVEPPALADADPLELDLAPGGVVTAQAAGEGSRFAVTMTPARDAASVLGRPVRVTRLRFVRMSPEGVPVSSLVGPGSIDYTDLPKHESLVLAKDHVVQIGEMNDFFVDRLGVRMEPGDRGAALLVEARGTAGVLRAGPTGAMQDRRLTRFEALAGNPALLALTAIVVWVFPTTLAARKLWKELRA